MIRTALTITSMALLAHACASSVRADDLTVLPVPRLEPVKVDVFSPRVAVAAEDTFPLTLLTNLEHSRAHTVAFGDTDHDGANELVFTGLSNSYRIWEHQGSNAYALVASGMSGIFYTYAVGDIDQDGRSEIVGQPGNYLQVLESLDAFSHPSQPIWSSPPLTNVVGKPTIADTDRDGQMEIVHSVNFSGGSTSRLAIFESTGDNALTQVFDGTVTGPSATGEKLIADFDGDGNLEIALCGIVGWLHVFESPTNNAWVLTAREWTGLFNAYRVVGGRDTDGNDRPEIFVHGDQGGLVATVVYESVADNAFGKVATIATDSGCGHCGAAVSNVDGVGQDEYLVISGPGIRVYRATAPSNWDLVGTAYGPGGGLEIFDLNQNGIPEVVWQSTTTQIFEHPGVPTDASVGSARPPRSLAIVPNPCRTRATLRFEPGTTAAAKLAVFDVRGRVVERRPVATSGPILWQPHDLPAGVYLVQLEDQRGRVLASGRGTFLR
jgi:hypothetical protein